MSAHPSFEAELGYAVARGRLPMALANVAILARYKDIDEAHRHALEVRRSADTWKHIRTQLRSRVADVARDLIKVKSPKNVVLARAHDINRAQLLTEQEVTDIVLGEVWASLPPAPRRTRNGR